ncbi:MAG: hypothetical protein HC887_02435 [Desulfobacteraceae bacterium]|nr:hypothetical protein [Desulfobacteraceae bacterium]
MFVDITSAANVIGILLEVIKKKLELGQSGQTVAIEPAFIGSMLWFFLLSILIRYFQTVILINRQYAYIHKVEENLCSFLGADYICREGKAYVRSYPIFSKWTKALYTVIFPIFLMLVVSVKIYKEFKILGMFYLGVNTVLFLMIIVSVVLYWIQLHHKK